MIPRRDGSITGIALRQTASPPKRRAQCAWCEDITLRSEVRFFSARRSGPDGRRGNTMATFICSDFDCSTNVRIDPSTPYDGFDHDGARARRIEGLRERVEAFAEKV